MSLIRDTVSRDTLESNVHFERLSVSRKSGRCAISRQKFRANISARFFLSMTDLNFLNQMICV